MRQLFGVTAHWLGCRLSLKPSLWEISVTEARRIFVLTNSVTAIIYVVGAGSTGANPVSLTTS